MTHPTTLGVPPPAPAAPEVEAADAALLSGPAAGDLLDAVLGAEGVGVLSWRLDAVHHRPGVGVTVGYAVRWGTTSRGDAPTGEEYLLATTCPVPAAPPAPGTGRTTVTSGDRTLTVWRHPSDPALPGLAGAVEPGHLAALLGADPTSLELVTYRPLRRCVLRVRTPEGVTYVKVVRPHTAADLVHRHRTLTAAGLPVADVRDAGDGVLLLGELPGVPLTTALAADGGRTVREDVVRQLLGMLDRLPTATAGLRPRPSWTDRLDHHADAAVAALPERAAAVRRVVREVRDLLAGSDVGPLVPTHGDLHGANLLVDPAQRSSVVGLLDVDSVGPGHRVDDLACFLGHLSVLPCLDPRAYRHVAAELPVWTERLGHHVDPVALRARAAAVVISLVAGARREGDPAWRDDADQRLAAAQAWVHEGQRVRGLSSGGPAPLMGRDEAEDIAPDRPVHETRSSP